MNFQAIWGHFQSIVIVPSIIFHSFLRVSRKPGISSEDTSLIPSMSSVSMLEKRLEPSLQPFTSLF